MSIINRFSFVVPNFTRHSYRENESVQTTIGICGRFRRVHIVSRVVLIAIDNVNTADHPVDFGRENATRNPFALRTAPVLVGVGSTADPIQVLKRL